MKKLFALILALGGTAPLALGQTITYDDVVVVVNSNDSVSVALGNYFMAARSIPAANLIAVAAPTAETIDATQFGLVKQQIKSYMMANSLVGPINYMVMMKGMPHRVGTNFCDSIPPIGCSSLDSELTLLFHPDSASMLAAPGVPNPLEQSTVPHAFSNNNVLVVTRLDGYSALDVTQLIDRSGPGLPVSKQDAVLIGDVENALYAFQPGFFHSVFSAFLDPLNSTGWTTLIDTVNNTLTGLDHVLAFLTFDGDPVQGTPDLNWANGALSMAYYHSSAASFNLDTNDAKRLRCADLIANGASGVRGSVLAPFSSEQFNMGHTLQRYLEQPGFNLAESYYAGIQLLSRSDLIIGDPKTSLTISVGLGPDAQRSPISLHAFPNPASDVLTVPIERAKVKRCHLLSMDGRVVAEPVLSTAGGPLSLSVTELQAGAYLLQLHTTEGLRMARFTVVH